MKVAIVGSRDFSDLGAVRKLVAELPEGTTVITGGARGVDKTAELVARERGLNVIVYHAKWNDLTHPNANIQVNKYGKKYDASAGIRRNEDIIKDADQVYAFWDGVSNGTRNSMGLAKKYGKQLTVFK